MKRAKKHSPDTCNPVYAIEGPSHHFKCIKKDTKRVRARWSTCKRGRTSVCVCVSSWSRVLMRDQYVHNIFAQNAINLELAAHFILMCRKLFEQKSAPSSSAQVKPNVNVCNILILSKKFIGPLLLGLCLGLCAYLCNMQKLYLISQHLAKWCQYGGAADSKYPHASFSS